MKRIIQAATVSVLAIITLSIWGSSSTVKATRELVNMESSITAVEIEEPVMVTSEPKPKIKKVKKIKVKSQKKPKYKDFEAPETSGFKSYESYTALTNRSSEQYKLQQKAVTGEYGIRQVDGRYCVALGSHFTSTIGTKFDLILENGAVIECVLGDQKADCHTDAANIISKNGCMSEFIVDMSALDYTAKRAGDISKCNEDWDSPVATVRVYK